MKLQEEAVVLNLVLYDERKEAAVNHHLEVFAGKNQPNLQVWIGVASAMTIIVIPVSNSRRSFIFYYFYSNSNTIFTYSLCYSNQTVMIEHENNKTAMRIIAARNLIQRFQNVSFYFSVSFYFFLILFLRFTYIL